MDPARYTEEMMAVRREMAGDPHRPQYHFQSPSNWVNDAHPIYWEGRYHMFYLYNPYGVTHGIVHWAHAVSDDLVHWTDWPIAMYPDTPYDKEGVRSGNVFINDDGVPTAIYTGSNGVTPNPVREQFGMLATSTDGMLTWQKHAVPVIPEPPYPGTPAHHDAQIWKDGDTWYQLVGGAYEGNGAAVLHSSKDLLQWSYAGRIFTGEDGKHGVFWELPYLLPYGRKDVMIIGIHPVPYFVRQLRQGEARVHPGEGGGPRLRHQDLLRAQPPYGGRQGRGRQRAAHHDRLGQGGRGLSGAGQRLERHVLHPPHRNPPSRRQPGLRSRPRAGGP